MVSGKRDYCHPRYYGSTPNRLYLGDGKGTFTDTSAASGIRSHPGKGMGAAMADFDRDGWMDIFVANDKLANFLFHNLGRGKFTDIALEAEVAYPADGSTVSGMGADFRDIDNDGWKDLFVSRGHVQANAAGGEVIDQHNSVFRNLANGSFAALTAEAGLAAQPARRHRGSATGDLDGDGRPDVLVTALGAPAEVWMNDSPSKHHWLELKLVGTVSNRDAIGATIKLTSKRLVQYNHVSTAAGYSSSSAGPVHFGLGPDDVADLIEIRWPSGIIQRLTGVKAGRVLEVREPRSTGKLPDAR